MCICGGGVSGAQRGFGGGASAVLGAGCWEGAGLAGIVNPCCLLLVAGKELAWQVLPPPGRYYQLGKSYH